MTADGRVALAMRQILRAAGEEQFAIVAYGFMPDHLHLLVEDIRSIGLPAIHLTSEAVLRLLLLEDARHAASGSGTVTSALCAATKTL